MQRQNATARWAKSRQTPLRSCVGLEGGAGRARMCVTKGQAVADEIANRLNLSPARRLGSEKLPGDVRELVGFSIAAAEQEDQCVVRQLLDGTFLGVLLDRVRHAAVLNDASRESVRLPAGAMNLRT